MEKYLIDTNTWIEYFHHRHGVAERMANIPFTSLYVSEITIAELIYGALHGKRKDYHLAETRNLQRAVNVIPISHVLDDYAEIRHDWNAVVCASKISICLLRPRHVTTT